MKKVVIIGAGQAGAAALLKLRELGFEGQITLLGEEAHPPYERPELSKGYALGKVGFERLVMLAPEQATNLGATMLLGEAARQIDRKSRRVETGSSSHDYDALILATGGRPRRLPLPPVLAARSHAVRSREDADRLGEALNGAASVVIIGGGWLGTEAAITARASGARVDLIETAPRLCARVAPVWLSGELARIQEGAGVTLHLGSVPQFGEDGTITVGETVLKPDVVIEAIGMSANDRLAVDAGIACSDGIHVDGDGRTDDPAIFAIGDCARYRHLGGLRRESWQNANQSAEDAARAILGLPHRAGEPDWFWSHQNDVNVQMLGQCPDNALQIERRGPRGGVSRLFVEANRLLGCVALNNPRDIAEGRRVIQSGQTLDTTRVADGAVALSRCVIDPREAVTVSAEG